MLRQGNLSGVGVESRFNWCRCCAWWDIWVCISRLETRTKEFNLYASARVIKLLREVKANVGQELLAGPRTTDRSRDMSKDSSWSTQVKTRKITNYTCVERSQKKSWWKFETVLTCKSIVKHEHSGSHGLAPAMAHSNFFPINFRCLGSGQTWLQRVTEG